jgi:hypothetical protein
VTQHLLLLGTSLGSVDACVLRRWLCYLCFEKKG